MELTGASRGRSDDTQFREFYKQQGICAKKVNDLVSMTMFLFILKPDRGNGVIVLDREMYDKSILGIITV